MNWIANTEDEQREMLRRIGASSLEDLFTVIPEEVRSGRLALPGPMSEFAVRNYCAELANKNDTSLVSFLGGGYYDHFIPAAVDALVSRGEFLTAYTPYQAECAQGTLQAIYEYQTAICRLTDMEFANASLYDGGTAVFEATTMAVRITNRRRIQCSPTLNPIYRRLLETHTFNLGLEIQTGVDPVGVACVIVQNPSFRGTVSDYTDLAQRCHEAGALLVVVFNPVSLGLLKTPGEMGADIAVAEGQSLGIPLSFGGPYLGILATKREYVRKMPGRLAAATVDHNGLRGFVLTLQAREQHIRREKAMSNICSNEALCALRALIYLCLLGPQGLKEVAHQCYAKTEYLKRLLPAEWLADNATTFNEFVVRLPISADQVVERMLTRGIVAGLPLHAVGAGEPTEMLIAVTEKKTRGQLEHFAQSLREVICS